MSTTTTDAHRLAVPLEELHQPREGGKGKSKGCLARHNIEDIPRTAGHHCSHQWMAQKQGEDADSALYNYPAYRSLELGAGPEQRFVTGAYIAKSGKLHPPGHALDQRRPRKREWDVGRGRNFKHYLVPYWHNAHHLIPNRTLSGAIDQACADDPSGRVAYLIRAGLLLGEYNLNDKTNMMILPMGAAVSESLRLPRHLNGGEGGPREFFGHPDYDTRVRSLITPVIDRYKALVKKRQEDHPKPPDKLSKDSLVSISETIRAAIKALAKRAPLANHSLDQAFGTGP
jgi:hypothetical protein